MSGQGKRSTGLASRLASHGFVRRGAEFGYAILRGYAQIYFCNHAGTGALFFVATALLFPAGAAYALAGLLIGTVTAYALRRDPGLIRMGLFGYNAALVGLAWAWFYSLADAASLATFALSAAMTVVLEAAWLKAIETGRLQLPSLSVPFVIVTWAAMGLSRQMPVGTVSSEPPLLTLVVAVLLAIGGMSAFSILLAAVAVYGALLGFGIALTLGIPVDIQAVSVAAFNSVPTAIALGGCFVVWGSRGLGLVTVAALAVGACWMLALEFLSLVSLVPLTAPFCLVTLGCLALIRSQPALARQAGLYLVPLFFASAPEHGLAWFKRERQAEEYWKRFGRADPRESRP